MYNLLLNLYRVGFGWRNQWVAALPHAAFLLLFVHIPIEQLWQLRCDNHHGNVNDLQSDLCVRAVLSSEIK